RRRVRRLSAGCLARMPRAGADLQSADLGTEPAASSATGPARNPSRPAQIVRGMGDRAEARKEILKRLLELNHKIHADEVAAGLWEKKGKKKKETNSVVKEPQINYNQEEMFGE
ncbi:MAG: hypothetical protein Q8M94_14615, partial [Ignavibacteria bacterium]|nr:hypothetical protein [Ignavibacteria bacterium]